MHIVDGENDLDLVDGALDGHHRRVLAAFEVLIARVGDLGLEVAIVVVDVLLIGHADRRDGSRRRGRG